MPPVIDRRRQLSRDEFEREYLFANKPVVIEDAVTDWPALKKWTPDWFESQYADREFTIDRKTWRFGDYIQRIRAGASEGEKLPYFRNKVVKDCFPELQSDLEPRHIYSLPDWLQSPLVPRRLTRPIHGDFDMHFGARGGRFIIHIDELASHAIVTQLYGEKEITLYEPNCPGMYPNPEDTDLSLVDADAPDLDAYPDFAKAVGASCRCLPGDTLFIPCGWWHTTQILSDLSINVGVNIVNGSNWDAFLKSLHAARWKKFSIAATGFVAYLRCLRMLRMIGG